MIHFDGAGWISHAAIWMLRAGWQASLLAALVIAAQRVLRGRLTARARCLMWGVVVVRLIIPPLPQTRWTMFPPRYVAAMTAAQVKPSMDIASHTGAANPSRQVEATDRLSPALVAELKAELAAMPLVPPDHMPGVAIAPAVTISNVAATPPAPAAISIRRTWPTILVVLTWLWLAGAGVCLIRILLASLRLHRLVRGCSLLDDPKMESLAQSCAREAGLRHAPPILDAVELSSPAVTGVFRPKLLLPSHLPIGFSRGELRLMLLHEFAHLRRRDLQLSWILSLLQALHWFNPVLRWAFNRLRADSEMACDEVVLTLTQPAMADVDSGRQSYGRTLLRLAEQMSHFPQQPMPAGLGRVGILDSPRHLHRRIVMIAAFSPASRKFSRTWPALAAGVMLLCAGLVLADAAEPSKPAPLPTPAPARPAQNVPTTPSSKPAAAKEAPPRREPSPTAPSSLSSSVVEALRQKYQAQQAVLDQVRAQYEAAEQRFRAGLSDTHEIPAARTEIARAEADLAAALVELRRAEASDTTPATGEINALELNAARMNLLAAGAARNQARANYQRSTAARAAHAMSEEEVDAAKTALAKAEADVAVRELEVRRAYPTRNAAGTMGVGGSALPPAAAGPNPFAAAGSLPTENVQDDAARRADFAAAEKLHKPMTADFVDAKLTDALQYFADKAGLDVVTDWKGMEAGAVSPDAPVNLRIRQQTPGDQILRFVLRDRGVGFTIDHGVLFISALDKIDRMAVTRVYDITVFGTAAADLPKLIEEVVDPNSWRDNDGIAGTVRVFADKLIVTQTFANQCEVEKLLALLAAKGGGQAMKPGAALGANQTGINLDEQIASLRYALESVQADRLQVQKALDAGHDPPAIEQIVSADLKLKQLRMYHVQAAQEYLALSDRLGREHPTLKATQAALDAARTEAEEWETKLRSKARTMVLEILTQQISATKDYLTQLEAKKAGADTKSGGAKP